MPEEIKNLVGTAMFSKKISDGNYGSEEASLFVQFDYDPAAPTSEILASAQGAFEVAKRRVLQELGVTSTANAPIPNPIDVPVQSPTERVLDAFPGAHVDPNPPVATQPPAAQAPSANAPAAVSTRGDGPACAKCGGTEWWDNRNDKRNPKAPDFKCRNKACGNGRWLTPYNKAA